MDIRTHRSLPRVTSEAMAKHREALEQQRRFARSLKLLQDTRVTRMRQDWAIQSRWKARNVQWQQALPLRVFSPTPGEASVREDAGAQEDAGAHQAAGAEEAGFIHPARHDSVTVHPADGDEGTARASFDAKGGAEFDDDDAAKRKCNVDPRRPTRHHRRRPQAQDHTRKVVRRAYERSRRERNRVHKRLASRAKLQREIEQQLELERRERKPSFVQRMLSPANVIAATAASEAEAARARAIEQEIAFYSCLRDEQRKASEKDRVKETVALSSGAEHCGSASGAATVAICSTALEACGGGEGASAGTSAASRRARRALVGTKHVVADEIQARQEPAPNQAQLDCERALSDLMAEEVWQDHAAAGLLPGWGKLPERHTVD